MEKNLVQVDFHPDGKVVRIYDDGNAKEDNVLHLGVTPKEALQKRLEEYKRSKTK